MPIPSAGMIHGGPRSSEMPIQAAEPHTRADQPRRGAKGFAVVFWQVMGGYGFRSWGGGLDGLPRQPPARERL
jgi:hypothetical protein